MNAADSHVRYLVNPLPALAADVGLAWFEFVHVPNPVPELR